MTTDVKRGRGRAAADGYTGLVKASVSLTPDMWAYLQGAGNGNYSVGLRKVMEVVMAAAEQGHAGTKATEPSAGVAAARAKLLKTRALVEKLELEKVNGRWKKGGYWMSITAERKMLEDHPELADYASRE